MEIPVYYQQSIECIFCKQSFKTTKIRSKFIKVEHHEDIFNLFTKIKKLIPFYIIFMSASIVDFHLQRISPNILLQGVG